MDTSFIIPLVEFLQTLSTEFLALLTFICCAVSILILFRLFGSTGLYLYNAVIVLLANIQVLKVVPFWLSPEPVALGTVAFATTYLVSDILTEHYGTAVARRGVWLSFAGHILMTVMMIITLGYSAPAGDKIQEAMMSLFTPSPRILLAGLLAYAISQLLDISLFDWVARLTQRRWLWLRTNIATLLSGLVDNALFSIFAWVLFSPTPISLYSLIFTYILGTYVSRALVAFMSTPVIYLSYLLLPKPLDKQLKKYEAALRKAA
jgi:queuosine precursor transporter